MVSLNSKNLILPVMDLSRVLSYFRSCLRTRMLVLSVLLLCSLVISISLIDNSHTSMTTILSSSHLSASNFISAASLVTSSNTHFLTESDSNRIFSSLNVSDMNERTARNTSDLASCDIFDGTWVRDDGLDPFYQPGSCPYIDDAFNCFNNGRSDAQYLRYRWQARSCKIPRFDGRQFLSLLRNKRMVFVGDSLNRNMWQSLVCALRESVVNKTQIHGFSGLKEFRTQGFYSFRFEDYGCSIEYVKSPFLVQQWKTARRVRPKRETLRLDTIQASAYKYRDADFLIFNTGHWWNHHKTRKGKDYFQEGDHVYDQLEMTEAFEKALRTWGRWVDSNVDRNHTRVFFRGYSASHYRGGNWNSGGKCAGETRPIEDDSHLGPYPSMMNILESVIAEMKTPVFYLNIIKMSDYRKDGHPSIYRHPGRPMGVTKIQDCSHWCLPGIPDSWNELLFANLLIANRPLPVMTS